MSELEMIEQHLEAERRYRDVLDLLGNDTKREGLINTPMRHVKFLVEFLTHEPYEFTTFESDTDEMVVVRNIPFYSLCEHHVLPFFGTANIGYIPTKKMVGLSKIPRCLDEYARGLQNQERITTQVANRLMKELEPKGVMVTLTAQHLCMAMRGVKKSNVPTTTSKTLGVFRTDQMARAEFLNLAK